MSVIAAYPRPVQIANATRSRIRSMDGLRKKLAAAPLVLLARSCDFESAMVIANTFRRFIG